MMLGYRNELVHDGQRYFLAYAILAVEPFVLVPLLLGFMSADMLGALAAIEAMVVVGCGATQLGVKFAYLQYVADVGHERRGPGWWSATGLTTIVGAVAGGLMALMLDLPWVVALLGSAPNVNPLVLVGLFVLTNLQMMLVTDLRARRSPLPFALSSAVRMIVMLTCVRTFGPPAEAPIDAVLTSQALALAVSCTLLGFIDRVPGRPVFQRQLAARFLGYGWPLALGNLIKYGTDALLPWLCLAMVSPFAAGAMALATKASAVFDAAFGQPFLMAWGGRAYYIAADGRAHTFFPDLFRWMLKISLMAACIASLTGYLIIDIFSGAEGPLTAAALQLIPFAVLARMLFTLHFPAAVGYIVRRDMRWNLWVALVKASLFLVLGPLGFMWGGAAGGWLAFVAGELAALAYIYKQGMKLIDDK